MSVLDRPRLIALLSSAVTVVTPNRRLARDLKREFDAARQAQGLQVWPAADVLPWSAWLARSVDEIEPGASRLTLLSALQQSLMWRQVVSESRASAGLPHIDALAATAEAAWDLLHEEGDLSDLEAARVVGNDDQISFRGWAHEFGHRLAARRAVSAAQLPVRLLQALTAGTWRPRSRVTLAGFDRLTAQQRRLAGALQASGHIVEVPNTPTTEPAHAVRIESADPRDQWQQVAAWARARLRDDPQARIGIVVPDLDAQREGILHALTDALVPALRVQPEQDAGRPFNLSLGRPLAERPLVATAFALFDLLCGPLEIARASALLRSPFLAGGAVDETEWARRSRLDRALRDDGAWQVSLDQLRRAARRADGAGSPHGDGAPRLAQALAQIAQRVPAGRSRRQALPAWITLFFGVLQDAGFPGTRALDSVEYQSHERLRELLAGLGSLDVLAGSVTMSEAVALLRRAAATTLFQPESPDVPVQVLGVLESAHLQFDHLWVADLSEDRWPPQPQPNPLLPPALQRAWGLPTASAELALIRAQQQMASWAASTREFIVSHACLEGDRSCLPSPLIAAVRSRPFDAVVLDAPLRVTSVLKRAIALEPIVDAQAPPLLVDATTPLRGGTRVFADQSACAFRAFATHRLHAVPLAHPEPGLDAAARGLLLHDTLATFWTGLHSQADLQALDDRRLHERVRACAQAALDRLDADRPGSLGPRLRDLEQERLMRAVHAWLDVEDQRPPFTVLAVETPGECDIGGLHVSLRPDRVDRLADGSIAVIDYKTGQVSVRDWLDPRPAQPQLPLYATAFATGAMPGGAQQVGAIAFVQVRPDKTRIVAIAAREGLLPDSQVVGDDEVLIDRPGWTGLLDDWQAILARLAHAFVTGDAAVAPRALHKTCEHCDLPLLCRREERLSLAGRLADDPGADRGSDDGDA
jgi:probable DNA repair protein